MFHSRQVDRLPQKSIAPAVPSQIWWRCCACIDLHGLTPRLQERGSRFLNLFNPEPNPQTAPRRDQDREMSKAKKAADKQILELSVALEITKFQRDAYREQIAKLEQRLADADRRAERVEERLHEATLPLTAL